MARLGLALAGGVIGGFFGGPIGAEIGLSIGGILGSALFPGQIPDGPRLNDLHISSATDGSPIPFGYNLNRVAANLIYTSGIKEITTTSATGGGGKGTTQQRNFTYFADFAAAFGEGPCQLGRVWFDSKIVYNSSQQYVPIIATTAAAGILTIITEGSLNVQPGTQVIITGTSLRNPTGVTTNLDQVTSVTSVPGPGVLICQDQTGTFFAQLVGGTIGPVAANGQTITKLSMVNDLVTAKCDLNPEVGSQVLIIDTPAALHANAYAGYFTVVQTAPTFFTYYNPSSPNLFTVGDDTGTVFCGYAVPALPQYAPPIFYAGTEAQGADPTIQAANGAANTPAFRGLAYAMWHTFPLANFGNRIPNIRAEVTYLKPSAQNVGAGLFLQNDYVRNPGAAPNEVVFSYTPQGLNNFVFLGLSMNQTGLSNKWVRIVFTNGPNGEGALCLASLPTASEVNEDCGPLGTGFPSTANILGFAGSGDSLTKPIVQVQVLNNVAILTLGAPCLYALGQNVTIQNLVNATFLNSVQLVLSSISADGFTIQAPFVHANYGPTADSGMVTNIGYLQLKGIGTPTAGLNTVTFPNNTKQGSLIVLVGITSDINASIAFRHSGATKAVTDSQGNSWSLDQNNDSKYNDNNTGNVCSLAYAFTNSAAPLTVTFNCTVVSGPGAVQIYLLEFPNDPPTTATYTLQDIVTDVCKRSGLTVSGSGDEIDVSSLVIPGTSTPQPGPTGYVVSRPSTGQDILRPLAQAYFFDGVESGGILKFVQRGGNVASLTIPESDLGLEKDNYKIEESISQAQDIPREVQVLFNDPALGYQQNKQQKRRHTRIVKTHNQFIYEFPFTIDASTARQISEKILFMDWIERKPYKFNTWKAVYDLLDPTDIVQFTYEGLMYQARVVKEQIGLDYKMEFTTVNENTSVYTSTAQGSSGIQPPSPIAKTVPNTILFLMDMPLLRDQDSNPTGSGYYWAASSTNLTDWTGMSLEISSDDNSFTQQDTSSVSCSYGVTLGVLPNFQFSPFSWDFKTTLTIRMLQGSLSGDTMLNVLNGSNALAIGSPTNGWEIVQFANVVQNADASFTISTLLRGRRGSEVFCGTHTAADTVILLSGSGANGVIHELASLANVQVLRYFRPTTFGQSVTSVTSQLFTNTANDLRPYAVTSVIGTRDGAGNLTVTWVRRTRIGGDWLEGIGTVPLSELSESYDVDVMGGSGSATVIRTFAGLSSPTVLYTAAQQIADFGRTLPNVTFNIYQNSGIIGRGFQKNATV